MYHKYNIFISNPIYLFSAEPVGCEKCNYHGTCYARDDSRVLCECFQWYAGENCHINLKGNFKVFIKKKNRNVLKIRICFSNSYFFGDSRCNIVHSASDLSYIDVCQETKTRWIFETHKFNAKVSNPSKRYDIMHRQFTRDPSSNNFFLVCSFFVPKLLKIS